MSLSSGKAASFSPFDYPTAAAPAERRGQPRGSNAPRGRWARQLPLLSLAPVSLRLTRALPSTWGMGTVSSVEREEVGAREHVAAGGVVDPRPWRCTSST
eukprot:956271-Alexandrium_andersonii.AAC.1